MNYEMNADAELEAYLIDFSDAELEAELARRRAIRSRPPSRILEPDFSRAVKKCDEIVNAFASGNEADVSDVVSIEIYRDMLEALYGPEIWVWFDQF